MFPEVTGSGTEVTSFHRKWPGQGCRKSSTRILGAFSALQGCISQKVPVTWKEMT